MKKILLAMAFIGIALSASDAAVVLSWNTFGNAGTETTEPSIVNDANIAAANLTFGVGITPAGNANRFGGSAWFDTGNTAGGNTVAEAITGNNYIQFIVTPTGGATFTLTSLVFSWDHSATGPSALTLRSSADSFGSNLGSVTGMAASLTTGNTLTITGISGITTATTFRLYGTGATATAGTGGFDTATSVANVVLNGTVAIPEPSTFALIGMGLGGLAILRRKKFNKV